MVNMDSLLFKDYVWKDSDSSMHINVHASLVLCRKLIARCTQVEEWNSSVFKQDFQRKLYLPVS